MEPATIAVHGGAGRDDPSGAVIPPLILTTIYDNRVAGTVSYGRYRNATWSRLEEALSLLEGGTGAVVYPSGMAAIAAVLETMPVAARVVAGHNAYSGTRTLLADHHRTGRHATELVDITDTGAVAAAGDGAALVMLESLTNPMLGVPDLRACAESAHAAGAIVLVDNTFATPLTVRPLALGADIVVHSLTKYIGGHSDLLLGAAIVSDERRHGNLTDQRTHAGAVPGQLECWLALRGLRTLDVRLRRQMASARVLAERLEQHPAVARVHYPGLVSHPHHQRACGQMAGGFGGVVSFEVRGTAQTADGVCSTVRLWTHATSLGAVESTLERRRRYPAEDASVPETLIRLSVGIEAVEDLWDDLSSALGQACG